MLFFAAATGREHKQRQRRQIRREARFNINCHLFLAFRENTSSEFCLHFTIIGGNGQEGKFGKTTRGCTEKFMQSLHFFRMYFTYTYYTCKKQITPQRCVPAPRSSQRSPPCRLRPRAQSLLTRTSPPSYTTIYNLQCTYKGRNHSFAIPTDKVADFKFVAASGQGCGSAPRHGPTRHGRLRHGGQNGDADEEEMPAERQGQGRTSEDKDEGRSKTDAIENGCKTVISQRFRQSGMLWSFKSTQTPEN